MLYVALMLLAFLQVLLSVVFSYKRHLRISRLFIYFSGVLFVWTLANTILDYTVKSPIAHDGGHQLLLLNWTNRIGFFTGTLSLIVLYRLMRQFPIEVKNGVQSRLVTVSGGLLVFLSLFPAISGSYSLGKDSYEYHYGSLALLIGVYFVAVAALSVKTVTVSFRTALSSTVKSQTKTILTSLLITTALAISIITVLPVLLHNDSFIFYGYFTPYIFTISLFYSIFRQSFLDFRLIIARSVTYLLVITSAVTVYVVLTFELATSIFGENRLSERVIPVIIAILLAFTIQPLQKFFDRLTNSLFYRDAYDAQVFLDTFNKMLASTYELEKLLEQAALIIQDNLKPSYCAFLINETPSRHRRIISTSKHLTLDKHELDAVRRLTSGDDKVIAVDSLGEPQAATQAVLQGSDIAAIGRLTLDAKADLDLGYVLLGLKKSGNAYSSQDYRMIEILTNELAIAVQNALRFEEIETFNATLQEKVTEATHKLRRTNEKLKALDETKDDFISMASHQLRTPLTSIKGYISMVLEEDAGKINDTQREMLGQAFISSQRMVYLIADLLNVSRLKTGKFIIETAPVNLADVVEQELAQLQDTAAARSLTLKYRKPKHFPDLLLDETKTRQVIMNFADNAIYYTPAGGHITVSLEEKAHSVELRIEDNGIGVPKSEQPHLFTKFYRAGNARQARPDGTGLGLFMAKKVIIAQGGSLIFSSHEGKGSSFGFAFSKSRIAQPKSKSTK